MLEICSLPARILIPRSAVSNDTAQYGWYVPVHQQTGTRTTRYWVVPWIGVVSTPLPPELVGNGRFRPLPPVTERYQSRKKMEKKRENLEIQCRCGEE
ncbi:hypothetical protein B296_00058643, partial [Ensete ventricosum]